MWIGGQSPFLKGLNPRDEELKKGIDDFLREGINCFPLTSSKQSQHLEYVTTLLKLLCIKLCVS